MLHVHCARRLLGVQHPGRQADGVILLLRAERDGPAVLGLQVDDVLTVLETGEAQLRPVPLAGRAVWLDALVACTAVAPGAAQPESALVQLLSPQRLIAALMPSARPAVVPTLRDAVPMA